MKKYVVGVDGSPGSRAALLWSVEQAKESGAEITVVFAFSFDLAWIDVGSDYQGAWIHNATEKAHQELHRIIAETLPDPPPVTVHGLVVEGEPAAVLVEIARHADLLVVGTRGRGGFAGLLLGSVSQRCAEHAPCPVVVVPSDAGAARD
jgi:nucleotide-binding universal stress UspA family protein